MPNLPKPTTKAPWLGLPIDVLDRNGDPIHIGDVLHFDSAEWGSDDEYFCVEFRRGEVRHPGSISDLSAWCVIVRKWDAGSPVTSPCRPDGRFATLELPPGATRRDAIGVYLALNGGGTPHTAEELERVRDLLRGEP